MGLLRDPMAPLVFHGIPSGYCVGQEPLLAHGLFWEYLDLHGSKSDSEPHCRPIIQRPQNSTL